MSDKLKQTLIDVTFAQGEQPDAYKLNGAFGQMETAIEFINKAIGDINNQNSSNPGTGLGVSKLSTLPSSGPSLGRLVGSANWLNPKRIGLVRKTVTVEMGFESTREVVDEVDGPNHYRTMQFRLPFPPVILTKNYTPGAADRKTMGDYTVAYSWDGAPGSWTIASPTVYSGDATGAGTGKIVQAQRVTHLNLLDSAGDYHVSADGVITLYRSLGVNEGFKVTYTFDTMGDAFTGATLNVIPDFAQTTTLCTVANGAAAGTYDITLPTIEALMGENFSGSDFSGTFGGPDLILRTKDVLTFPTYQATSGLSASPSYGAQCVLPEVITTNLSPGDTIPEGYIYLWDETTDKILNGGTFTYLTTSSVNVSGLSLVTGSTRYRVIVAGADIARVVSSLRESYVRHTHDGRFDSDGVFRGERIRHADLLDCGDETYDMVSSIYGPTERPHCQYLHRGGYDASDGGTSLGQGNFRNAMAGNLVFCDTSWDLSNSKSSFGIYFGSTSGPKLSYENISDVLKLYNKGLYINTSSPAAPPKYTLYRENVVKAKCHVTCGAATCTVATDFNISSVTASASLVTITYATAISTSDAGVINITAGSNLALNDPFLFQVETSTTTNCTIRIYDNTLAAINPSSVAVKFHFIAI